MSYVFTLVPYTLALVRFGDVMIPYLGRHFTGYRFLLKITQRDLAPDVPVEIDEDFVESRNGIEELRHVVMGFNLGGVRIPAEAKRCHE